MNDFAIVNRIYEQTFGNCKPGRSTVEVTLVMDLLVEIECVARRSALFANLPEPY